MWKFITGLFKPSEETQKLNQYENLLKAIQTTLSLNGMIMVKRKIVEFRETWGECPFSEDLYTKFDERLKFVIMITEKKRKYGKKRNAR